MTERRNTRQLDAIRELLAEERRPLSIEEIYEGARRAVPTLGVRTVYRVMHRLEDEELVARVAIPGQPDRYELAEVAAKHHHHFHCIECDRVFDVQGCPGHLEKMVPDGFVLDGHEITLHGRCNHCA